MKKFLAFFSLASILLLSSSCTKENLKKVKKELTGTNAKSQGSSGGTATPPAAASDHQGGCPNHTSAG